MLPRGHRLLAVSLALVFAHAAAARADGPEATAATPGTSAAADDAAAATPPGTPAAKTARAGNAVRLAQIDKELTLVEDEQDSVTRLWPVLTIALGITAVVVGATSGAIDAFRCDGSCQGGAWQGVTVVAGSAVATGGVVWLRWTNDDARELDTRRYRLERERDHIEASVAVRERPGAGSARAVVLGVQGRF
jgi:hypothetical protein